MCLNAQFRILLIETQYFCVHKRIVHTLYQYRVSITFQCFSKTWQTTWAAILCIMCNNSSPCAFLK